MVSGTLAKKWWHMELIRLTGLANPYQGCSNAFFKNVLEKTSSRLFPQTAVVS